MMFRKTAIGLGLFCALSFAIGWTIPSAFAQTDGGWFGRQAPPNGGFQGGPQSGGQQMGQGGGFQGGPGGGGPQGGGFGPGGGQGCSGGGGRR